MAKKEYSPGVAELADLKKLNSRLVSHCNVYALVDRVIWLHSSISFVEKIGFVKDWSAISFYDECMINAIELRGFLSGYRKTSTEVIESEKEYYLRDSKDDTRTGCINKLGVGSNPDARTQQIKSMYRHLTHDKDPIGDAVGKLIDCSMKNSESLYDIFTLVDQDVIDGLRDNRVMSIFTPQKSEVFATKSLFGSVNATQKIGVVDLPKLNDKKHHVLFVQEEPEMFMFTVAAVLDIQ